MALVEVTDIDVRSDFEDVWHGPTAEYDVREDRESVVLTESTDTELAVELVVSRREAYPVAAEVSIHR